MSTARQAEANRKARARNGVARPEDGEAITVTPRSITQPMERTGLEWLLHKKRINPRQFWAGTAYGNLYRSVSLNGVEPLRSCINDSRGAGGSQSDVGKVPGMSFAELDLDAHARLTACHTLALRSETALIATVAAVCGRQLTPREITTNQVDCAQIEAVLGVALNLLAAHMERKEAA